MSVSSGKKVFWVNVHDEVTDTWKSTPIDEAPEATQRVSIGISRSVLSFSTQKTQYCRWGRFESLPGKPEYTV